MSSGGSGGSVGELDVCAYACGTPRSAAPASADIGTISLNLLTANSLSEALNPDADADSGVQSTLPGCPVREHRPLLDGRRGGDDQGTAGGLASPAPGSLARLAILMVSRPGSPSQSLRT